eukprot:2792994-Rhodomonas_salina.1
MQSHLAFITQNSKSIAKSMWATDSTPLSATQYARSASMQMKGKSIIRNNVASSLPLSRMSKSKSQSRSRFRSQTQSGVQHLVFPRPYHPDPINHDPPHTIEENSNHVLSTMIDTNSPPPFTHFELPNKQL